MTNKEFYAVLIRRITLTHEGIAKNKYDCK